MSLGVATSSPLFVGISLLLKTSSGHCQVKSFNESGFACASCIDAKSLEHLQKWELALGEGTKRHRCFRRARTVHVKGLKHILG